MKSSSNHNDWLIVA